MHRGNLMAMRIEIHGLKELEKKLEALQIKPAKVRKVLLRGAMLIKKEAQRRAPYDKGREKGTHLRDAIMASAKPRFPDDLSAFAAVSSKKAPHAKMVEYGTGPRFQKKTHRYVGQMPANPFFRTAIDAASGGVATIVHDGLKELIDKAVTA